MKRTIHFSKMHGAGNDYIYVYVPENPISDPCALSKRWSRSHFGIGSDGLILIDRSDKADFQMRIFNNDGSEAMMCGNGIRCVGKFVRDHRLTDKSEITVETLSGVKTIQLFEDGQGSVDRARVDMGAPVEIIPMQAGDCGLPEGVAVSMGNPHFVQFVDDISAVQLERDGVSLERHEAFADGCNIEFAQLIAPNVLRMRVWERGSGVTLACGTGACATAVASVASRLTDPSRPIEVVMDGGRLSIEWSSSDDHVYMTGPAARVFEGTIEYDDETITESEG